MTTWEKCLQHIAKDTYSQQRKEAAKQQDYESKKDMARQITRGEIQTARKSGKYSELTNNQRKTN